jgi:hypothetical protein
LCLQACSARPTTISQSAEDVDRSAASSQYGKARYQCFLCSIND